MRGFHSIRQRGIGGSVRICWLMRIIILEENAGYLRLLLERLQLEGLDVQGTSSLLGFYQKLAAEDYDVAVVDADFRENRGLETLSWLQNKRNVGIIALTAGRSAHDRIACFKSGADLLIPKPVEADELMHGLRSLVRRMVGKGLSRVSAPPPIAWFFDPAYWELEAPNGAVIKLTSVETKLVQRLLLQLGAVVSRADLRFELGYTSDQTGDRNLDAVIRRLRRKIEEESGLPAPVQTVHGQGHLFSASLRLERRGSRRAKRS